MTQTPLHLRNREYVYDIDPTLQPTSPPAPALVSIAPARQHTVTTPKPYVAPIDRRRLDALRPSFYLLLAGAFFALSVISTVAQVGRILELGGLSMVGWQMITAGLVIAGIITAGELLTGEGMVYFCFLIPDVTLTVWWMWPALLRWSIALGAGPLGAAIAGIALGILTAWIPERVIIGRRRRAGRQGA